MRAATVLFIALCLAACGDDKPRTTDRYNESGNNIISSVTDYGSFDGCSVKWVRTREHPDFWFIRCPDATVATEYETGSKAKTHVGAVAR